MILGDSMVILYIIFILFIVIGLISVFVIVTLDNIKSNTVRLNEANANIEATLNKRFDLLNKSNDIIRDFTQKEGDILETIANIRSQKLNNFELDKELYKAIEEFHNYTEENALLKENEDYTKIEIQLIESEAEIVALKKYYNDIATKYNELVSKFPSVIVAKIKDYKSKELFVIEDHLDLINSLK